MQIENIWVSQRKLRNVAQVVSMQIAISRGLWLPPITIARCEDGSYQVEDGHHRLVAHWLCGQGVLQPPHFIFLEKDRWKPRFGRIHDLLTRILEAT
jgi:hypothetical protein